MTTSKAKIIRTTLGHQVILMLLVFLANQQLPVAETSGAPGAKAWVSCLGEVTGEGGER